MHQHPRHPPRTASPASSPQTNPTRSNNPREGIGSQARAPESPRQGLTSSSGSGEFELKGPSPESMKKLDSIVQVRSRGTCFLKSTRANVLQNLFLKAAVLVAQARIKTTPLGAGKTNKWVCPHKTRIVRTTSDRNHQVLARNRRDRRISKRFPFVEDLQRLRKPLPINGD